MRDPGKTKYSLDFVKKWLNDAERQYCNKTNYSVKKDITISTASGTREYNLPADFISEINVFHDGKPLPTIEMEDTIHAAGDKSGTPYGYYIENKKIGFEPVPTAIKVITLIYNSRGGAMTAASSTPIIPDEHHMLLVAGACIWASIEGDDTRLTTFQQIWTRGLAEATEDVINLSPWPQMNLGQGPYPNPVTHDLIGPY